MALSNKLLQLVERTFKEKAKISKISADMRGKVITIYGSNNLGKTKQSSKFKNPIFIPFEKGMNAVSGALVLKNTCWADFKNNVKILSSKSYTDILKEEQVTVICDGLEKAGVYCQKYIEQKHDVTDVSEGKGGYGLWKQYEKEMWSEVDKLLGLGYTIVWLGHPDYNKDMDKIVVKGDKRNTAPIIDNSDFVVYLKSNGVDEQGETILSSAYLAETDEFFARSRFEHVENYIEEFTSENLEKAIIEGIKKQQKIEGIDDVAYEEQKEVYGEDEEDFDSILEEIKNLYLELQEMNELEFYCEVVAEYLGEGAIVSEASKRQIQPLICIRQALKDKIKE